ncbi:NRDE family protein [Flectobacillus longus]|uniref:NRDE family protein n=1 Tax=Flectobacillus longus TaxID=2984207 RepID=UPI0024B6C0A6|nr:NRDE family protein [Flectobacillus longus]MDI9880036.1 NRDE family protein [Flectobacillus longus]
MCVLTFVPKGDQNFILTNNRDEANARPKAIPPQVYQIGSTNIYMPKDALAGGTWIATSENFTLCLLNGAFENHIHQPPYRQSRGTIIPAFFEKQNLTSFLNEYLFEGIENFTLIVIEHQKELFLTEIRWDGHQLFVAEKNAQESHIWSSATLYNAQIRHEREHWFEQLLNQYPAGISAEVLLDFHQNGGNGDIQNDMRMNRNNTLMTQCIMQVVKQSNGVAYKYIDFV